MKKYVLILTLAIVLLLCSCTPSNDEMQSLETTLPTETTLPVETTLPPETTISPETTIPETTAQVESFEDFSEYYELLSFSGPERNWINAAIGCVFEKPEDIDLNFLFYLGTEGGSWQDISPESEQSLIDQGFLRDMDLQVMPAEDLENVLQSTFGISLSDVTIPESWGYVEKENAYCSNHSDAYFVLPNTITAVNESEDGTVAISYAVDGYYIPQKDEFLDSANLILTLQKTESGGWMVLSNVIAE